MTVDEVAENATGKLCAWCHWFINNKAESDVFPVTVLAMAKD